MRDERTGLAMLPLAFTDLAALSARQRAGLTSGLRQLAADYELTIVDVGAAARAPGTEFIRDIADHVLIVARQDQTLQAMRSAAALADRHIAASVARIEARADPGKVFARV